MCGVAGPPGRWMASAAGQQAPPPTPRGWCADPRRPARLSGASRRGAAPGWLLERGRWQGGFGDPSGEAVPWAAPGGAWHDRPAAWAPLPRAAGGRPPQGPGGSSCAA